MTDDAEWGNIYTTASATPLRDNEGLRDSDFWYARPELRSIYENSRRTTAAPWAVLGLAVCRSLVSIPWWVQYQSFIGTAALNVGVVFVGDSGGGKSILSGVLDAALPFVGLHAPNFSQVEVGSGEAMADVYAHPAEKDDPQNGIRKGDLIWHNRDRARMFSFDEVGRMFKMANRDSGSTVFEYVKQGISGGPMGRVLAKGMGTQLDPKSYRFAFTTNAQPSRSGVLLNDDEIAGGFPGRLLWFETRDPRAVIEKDRSPVVPHPVPDIDWRTVRVINRLPQMDVAHEQERDEYHQDRRDPLDGHRSLAQAKVAVALMRLNGRTFLNDEDWELAGTVMNESIRVRTWVQSVLASKSRDMEKARGEAQARQQVAAENAVETLTVTRIVDKLKEYQAEGIDKKYWYKKVAYRDRPYYEHALAILEGRAK